MKSSNNDYPNDTNNYFSNAYFCHKDNFLDNSISGLIFNNKQEHMEVQNFEIFEKTEFKKLNVSLNLYPSV
jgi:hypothetical protein